MGLHATPKLSCRERVEKEREVRCGARGLESPISRETGEESEAALYLSDETRDVATLLRVLRKRGNME